MTLPVTIVTGFLGAGKTTLLRALVDARENLRIGLVINEFGEAGIDVPPGGDRAYIELAQGCACCIRSPDLVRAMDELSARGDLDRVLVETSGLADPLPIEWAIARPELLDRVRVDAVVGVVDAANFAFIPLSQTSFGRCGEQLLPAGDGGSAINSVLAATVGRQRGLFDHLLWSLNWKD